MSVRITDFSFFLKYAILTDMSVDFTDSSVNITKKTAVPIPADDIC